VKVCAISASRNCGAHTRRKSSGLSLIELMIAMALGLAIVAAVGYVYIQGQQGFKAQDDQSRLQDEARFAVELISRDIRNARFMGCPRVEDRKPDATANTPIDPNFRILGVHPYFTPIGDTPLSQSWLAKGGQSTDNATSNQINISYMLRGFDGAVGFPATSAITSRIEPNTDVLMLMKEGNEGRPITQDSSTGQLTVTSGGAIPGYRTDGDVAVMVVSSCSGGIELIKPTVKNGGLRFDLDNTLNALQAPTKDGYNLLELHSGDLMVAPFEPVAYYITSAVNNPSTGLPTLTRVTIRDRQAASNNNGIWDSTSGGQQRVVPGVENMQLRFLVNGAYLTPTEINALGSPNKFWGQASAVEVTLTIVSLGDKVRIDSEAQTNQGVTKTDRRIRQEIRFVVEVENRQNS
jgi:type II secretory pathway pseudopilin PulG